TATSPLSLHDALPIFHFDGRWVEVRPAMMDSGIAVDRGPQTATALKFCDVRKGMEFVVGHRGVRVVPHQRSTARTDAFEFMASNISSEKPKSAVIREMAEEFRKAKQAGVKDMIDAGPA